MSCDACADFKASGQPALYSADCLDCKARSLANGPIYFESQKHGRLTDAYKAALQKVFGAEWKTGHERVKRFAERMRSAAE